jgi:hypothetical protein
MVYRFPLILLLSLEYIFHHYRKAYPVPIITGIHDTLPLTDPAIPRQKGFISKKRKITKRGIPFVMFHVDGPIGGQRKLYRDDVIQRAGRLLQIPEGFFKHIHGPAIAGTFRLLQRP